jgi:hypothetical protein
MMFKITREWLKSTGALNKRQYACLGIEYPPSRGWIDRLIGKEIAESNQRQFESLKGCSQHAEKIKLANETHQFEAFYITTPDGKGSWTGRWGNEFRWHFPSFRKKP